MTIPTSLSEGSPFDIGKIRQLVRLMRDNDLAEIDLRWETCRIRLRRGLDNHVIATAAPSAPVLSAGPGITAPAEPAAEPSAPSITINSPIVGTFYTAPSPDTEAFVQVGSQVHPETTICIIEAMKVFNEIPAGVSGTITAILVENGAAVEYGQPLFRVRPD